jgi:ATP-dependent DNA ligase
MLPFKPPVDPMLCKLTDRIPAGEGFLFEPKWDGFRALVFRDGDEVYIQSREMKPIARYFPELEGPLKESLPSRCVLDGEIVIANDGRLDFDSLLLRIHPAKSRIDMLAKERPASYVAFDCMAIGDEDLRDKPQEERRKRLEAALVNAKPPIHLTPVTRDQKVAKDWFERFEGAGLDGVIAKPASVVYSPGKRALIKIKHARTADCVVAGFRWYKDSKGELVGSLLLGLYDEEGKLHHVGIAASFKREERKKLAELLEPLREGAREVHPWREWASFDHDSPSASAASNAHEHQRMPGATSRWNRGKDLSWEPIRLERVAEVGYDHLQGSRFRHATHFKRWREDKSPSECRYAQLEETPAFELEAIFGKG